MDLLIVFSKHLGMIHRIINFRKFPHWVFALGKEDGRQVIRGQSKKSESWAVHLLICWLFLLFYSNNIHTRWMKIWFLTRQMPVLSGRTNFDPFLKTWKFFTLKFPMKYSKNGQNFTTFKNILNFIFETCWAPCKKPHFSMWPRSRNTFFLTDPLCPDSPKQWI